MVACVLESGGLAVFFLIHSQDNLPTLPRKMLCFLAEFGKQPVHIVATLLRILGTGFPNFLKYYGFFYVSMVINSVGVIVVSK